LLGMICLCYTSFSQNPILNWAKQMGGTTNDQAFAMAVDASGNVYLTGSFTGTADFDPGAGTFNLVSAGTFDVFVVKLNSSGDLLWAKSMGGSGSDVGNSIAID